MCAVLPCHCVNGSSLLAIYMHSRDGQPCVYWSSSPFGHELTLSVGVLSCVHYMSAEICVFQIILKTTIDYLILLLFFWCNIVMSCLCAGFFFPVVYFGPLLCCWSALNSCFFDIFCLCFKVCCLFWYYLGKAQWVYSWEMRYINLLFYFHYY